MTATTELARATSERGDLVLRRHPDGRLELRANGVFVMDDHEVGTERALAATALDAVADPQRVLVGGLGLGFTLRRVLEDDRVHRCDVVEIEPALVDWLIDGTVPRGPELLADARTHVVIGDVGDVLRHSEPATYDLVLLDVDNGPGYLVHEGNAELYQPPGLRLASRACRPGGRVTVWSAAEARALDTAMRAIFDDVTTTPLPVRLGSRDETYWIYSGKA